MSINSYIRNEITNLASLHQIDVSELERFAQFVIDNHKKKDKVAKPVKEKVTKPKPPTKPKPLTLSQLKAAIYEYFSVKDTTELKKSGSFKMSTDGMDALNLSGKDGWEILYRKLIGILPNEINEQGYGCINGINIFNYFKPWQVFGLDGKTATPQDIKNAYYALSKIYHPDMGQTSDPAIFDRITVMYKSIGAEA